MTIGRQAKSDVGGEEWDAPGAPPYRRGIHESMYVTRPWNMLQYAGYGTAEAMNEEYLKKLRNGETGLSIAFDLPTHRGYDSDHEAATYDVGIAGIAIDSVEDMRKLLANVPLHDIPVSMAVNGAALPILAMYIVAAEEYGFDQHRLKLTLQNDVLKEYDVRHTYIFPPGPSVHIALDVAEYCFKNIPGAYPFSVSGYHFRESGADYATEVALAVSAATEYVTLLTRRGIAAADAARKVTFFFGTGTEFLLEAAKLRAARWVWHDLLRERFEVVDPTALKMRVHCQTLGSILRLEHLPSNTARATVQALGAVLGGTQGLHICGYDEPLGLPSEDAAHTAISTQRMLANEAGLTTVVDPLGGSYYVEAATEDLRRQISALWQDISDAGGLLEIVEKGVLGQLVPSLRTVRLPESAGLGDEFIVDGRDLAPGSRDGSALKVRDRQLENLHAVRASRDSRALRECLAAVRKAAQNRQNLVGACIEAARVRATVGEITDTLESVYARHHRTSGAVLNLVHDIPSRQVYALGEHVAAFRSTYGRPPRVMVAKIGQDGHDRGAKIIATLLADLGFEVTLGALFQTAHQVARDAIQDDVDVIGLSIQTGDALRMLSALLEALRKQSASYIAVTCGGTAAAAAGKALLDAGAAAIFAPGTDGSTAAAQLLPICARSAMGRINDVG